MHTLANWISRMPLGLVSQVRGWPLAYRLSLAVGMTVVAFLVQRELLYNVTSDAFTAFYAAVLLCMIIGGSFPAGIAALLAVALDGLGSSQHAPSAIQFLAVSLLMIVSFGKIFEPKSATTARQTADGREDALLWFIEQAPFAIAMFDRQMIFRGGSQRWCDSFGVSREAQMGRCHYDTFPNLPERFKEAHRRGLNGETVSRDFESYAEHSGKVRYSEWEVRPWIDDQGEIGGILIFVLDFTQKVEAQQELKRSEERLRLAVQAGRMAIWDWDVASGQSIWNEQLYEMLGYEPAKTVASYEAWACRLHPEDRPRVEATITEALQKRWLFHSTFRIYGPNDEIRWHESFGIVARDESRSRDLMYGVTIDITDRVLKEQDLQHRLGEIEALYNNAPIGLTLIDKDMRYLRINDALARINSAPAAAHTGRTLREMVPQLANDLESRTRAVFASGRVIITETTTENSELGKRTWREIQYPVRDASGSVAKVGIIVEDITEQKKAENHAKFLLSEVNHRAKNLLAVVQFIAEMTLDCNNPRDFASAFRSRIAGVAACHDLLVRSAWRGVDLRDLIESQIGHLDSGTHSQIELTGPDITVNAAAAQTLGMAMHELGTNALKHGALAVNGNINVSWTIDSKAGFLTLRWAENSGPSPGRSTRKSGFGWTVIKDNVEHGLDATVSIELTSRGLVYSLRAPLGVIVDDGRDSDGLTKLARRPG
jgi:PAS domain S-box-containing protein